MRAFVILGATFLPLIGCSQTPTGPTTPAASTSPIAFYAPLTNRTVIWHATSTVVDVSPTGDSCRVDQTIGETRNVDWAIEDNPSATVSIVIFVNPAANYLSDPAAPVYVGSRTDNHFTTEAMQDGGFTCFVWHGDLTGSFSADGRTFDAVENITYFHSGEDNMVVRRHWTGARQN